MKWNTSDIRIRDPFIYVDQKQNTYWLFGTTEAFCSQRETLPIFQCYQSADLQTWEGPFTAFKPSADFSPNKEFWAPEVHQYKDRYYMFATFRHNDDPRGVMVLSSDRIQGPYEPYSDGFVTPPEWFSLDGTLYIDQDQQPWIVFCHEWIQIQDGTLCAAKLSKDLKTRISEPIQLFKASEAPWTTPIHNQNEYVTDGPFMIQKGKRLFMLWSSFAEGGYALGVAESENGRIDGKWKQHEKLVYSLNGGHGMSFTDLQHKTFIALHAPNSAPNERAVFLSAENFERCI
ncbi:MAG: glycoside hydrolase family 43 protein [Lentisphaeria bacterium]